jgi:hypothetical protein
MDLAAATRLIRQVCQIAGEPLLLHHVGADLKAAGVTAAVQSHDTGVLFEWMMDSLSYQGIADTVARGYMDNHGRVKSSDVIRGLKRGGACAKLASFEAFSGCGYRKGLNTCSKPFAFDDCALPRHNLRNGRLNQTAYSLHLFLRDIARGDLVDWLDRQLELADRGSPRNRGQRLAMAVVEPMRNIYGVSDKVLAMTLSWLLLAGDPGRDLR